MPLQVESPFHILGLVQKIITEDLIIRQYILNYKNQYYYEESLFPFGIRILGALKFPTGLHVAWSQAHLSFLKANDRLGGNSPFLKLKSKK